jgi:hypothetical protein
MELHPLVQAPVFVSWHEKLRSAFMVQMDPPGLLMLWEEGGPALVR